MGKPVGIDARVGTGDEQSFRLLAVDELLKQVVQLAKVLVLKLMDALNQVPHRFRSLNRKGWTLEGRLTRPAGTGSQFSGALGAASDRPHSTRDAHIPLCAGRAILSRSIL
jgi:hypothetical protein